MHIEGSLEPELIFELAERNSVQLPYTDLDDLRSRYEFTDLQSFLDLYFANMQVLRTAQDFADLTRAYFARASAGGVAHVEFFFNPQAHVNRGVPLHEVLDGIMDAVATSEREFGLSSAAIAAILRDRPVHEAEDVFGEIVRLQTPIVGLGLDSAEVGNPPSLFEDVFARARSEGLHVVAHAGEEGPPEYIWQALDLLGAGASITGCGRWRTRRSWRAWWTRRCRSPCARCRTCGCASSTPCRNTRCGPCSRPA